MIKDCTESEDYELHCSVEPIDRLPREIKDYADSRDYELRCCIEQIDRLPRVIKSSSGLDDFGVIRGGAGSLRRAVDVQEHRFNTLAKDRSTPYGNPRNLRNP